MSETKPAIFIPGETGEVSDGYHTFNELYDHRIVLFIALAHAFKGFAWKAKAHHDGSGIGGWFIAGMNLPTGDITYHLPNGYWEMLKVTALERAPQWDGHKPQDVVDRLRNWAVQL